MKDVKPIDDGRTRYNCVCGVDCRHRSPSKHQALHLRRDRLHRRQIRHLNLKRRLLDIFGAERAWVAAGKRCRITYLFEECSANGRHCRQGMSRGVSRDGKHTREEVAELEWAGWHSWRRWREEIKGDGAVGEDEVGVSAAEVAAVEEQSGSAEEYTVVDA